MHLITKQELGGSSNDLDENYVLSLWSLAVSPLSFENQYLYIKPAISLAELLRLRFTGQHTNADLKGCLIEVADNFSGFGAGIYS
jgi:hypothetical protein